MSPKWWDKRFTVIWMRSRLILFLLALFFFGACSPQEEGVNVPIFSPSPVPTSTSKDLVTPFSEPENSDSSLTLATSSTPTVAGTESIVDEMPNQLDGTILVIETGLNNNRIRNILHLSLNYNEVKLIAPQDDCIGAVPFRAILFCSDSAMTSSARDVFFAKQLGPSIQNDRGWLDGVFLIQADQKAETAEYNITNILTGNVITFSPTGSELFWPRVSGNGDIASVQFQGGQYVLLIDMGDDELIEINIPQGYYLTGTLAWSPDSHYLVVGATNYQYEILGLSNVLFIYDHVRGEIQVLLELPVDFQILDSVFYNSLSAWSADSSSLAVALTGNRIVVINVPTIKQEIYEIPISSYTSFAWSPSNRFVAVVAGAPDDESSLTIIDSTSGKIILRYPLGKDWVKFVLNWVD